MKKVLLVFFSVVVISISLCMRNNIAIAFGQENYGDGSNNYGNTQSDGADGYGNTGYNGGYGSTDGNTVYEGVNSTNMGYESVDGGNAGYGSPQNNTDQNYNYNTDGQQQQPQENPQVLRSPYQPNKNPQKAGGSGQGQNSLNLLGQTTTGYRDGSTGYCLKHSQPLFNGSTKCVFCFAEEGKLKK